MPKNLSYGLIGLAIGVGMTAVVTFGTSLPGDVKSLIGSVLGGISATAGTIWGFWAEDRQFMDLD